MLPTFFRRGCLGKIVVTIAVKRASRFGLLSAVVLFGTLVWAGVRFYLSFDGENQVSEGNFRNLAVSISRTIQQKVTQDLIYQDMIANVWATKPSLSRESFRKLVTSETYAPGLQTMTGISLIPRVLGPTARRALEQDAGSERFRQECCAGAAITGTKCATISAGGMFCNAAGELRYQFTQNGPNGTLVPAIGNSSDYLSRVGAEEYMIVDMIEPFSTNSRVWGFNLLSSPPRLSAWRDAMRTGKRTFTRRLNLVQVTSAEYGVLVWLPIFQRLNGKRTTALNGNLTDLEAVGSINGVYRAQQLLTKAIQSTYSPEQLADLSIFLFDNAAELGGMPQFLAAYGASAPDPYTAYSGAGMNDVTQGAWTHERIDLEIPSSDARWVAVIVASDGYLSKRRTWNPIIGLVISLVMVVGGAIERLLGHPMFMVGYLQGKQADA